MKISNEFVFNVIFWLLYFLYQWLGLASLYGGYDGYFLNACMALPVSLLFSLLAVHVLFKRLYVAGKKTQFWIWLVLCSFVLLLMRRYVNYFIVYPRYFPEALRLPFFSFGKLLVEFVNLFAITGLYALYYFISSWHKERYRVQELLQQKTMAELNLLKSQVQPHFVFNALNNIYATAMRSSPETAALISHLSGFLDYNLYDATRDKVPLTSELSYIDHYIELQKNRYGSRLDVSVNIFDEINDLQITPLLLLPLIENSFKHGVAGAAEASWVRLDVSRQKHAFSIKIENSTEEKNGMAATAGGIGLANVRKRLQLVYPGAHELEIIEGNHSYLVVLKLKIGE